MGLENEAGQRECVWLVRQDCRRASAQPIMLCKNSRAKSADSFISARQAELAQRVVEHTHYARNSATKSPWGVHFQNQHPSITIPPSHTTLAAVSIVAGERDRAQRNLKEAVEI